MCQHRGEAAPGRPFSLFWLSLALSLVHPNHVPGRPPTARPRPPGRPGRDGGNQPPSLLPPPPMARPSGRPPWRRRFCAQRTAAYTRRDARMTAAAATTTCDERGRRLNEKSRPGVRDPTHPPAPLFSFPYLVPGAASGLAAVVHLLGVRGGRWDARAGGPGQGAGRGGRAGATHHLHHCRPRCHRRPADEPPARPPPPPGPPTA